MNVTRMVVAMAVALMGAGALAQESEFKGKMKEDLDGYVEIVASGCGVKATIEWTGGKLGHNPRESEKPDWQPLAWLCTYGVSALRDACVASEPVKNAVAKVTRIECTRGKGTVGYSIKGNTLTFTVDASFTGNNGSGQQSDLEAKLKKDLDA